MSHRPIYKSYYRVLLPRNIVKLMMFRLYTGSQIVAEILLLATTPFPRPTVTARRLRDSYDEEVFRTDLSWFGRPPLAARIAQKPFEHESGDTESAVGSAEERTGDIESYVEADADEPRDTVICKVDALLTTTVAPSSYSTTPSLISFSSKGKEKVAYPTSPDDQCEVSQDPYTDWAKETVARQQNHFILRRSPRSYFPDSTSDLEQHLYAPTETPTELHLTAVARLAPNQRIRLLREFFHQNSARFEAFCARMQPFPSTTKSTTRECVIKTIYSSAWDDQIELRLLTSAIVWVDALLLPFRAEILAEDESRLKPGLQEVCRPLQRMRCPLRFTMESKLGPEESAVFDHYSKQIVRIQTSNILRRAILEQTEIDVALFENLLLSAEIVRYRRDLGREYGLKDDLIDGLRRIYSTVVCTIPVGLSAADSIDLPVQEENEQYGFGPFESYRLPSRPEFFDHESIAATRISAQGHTGIQFSDQQSPLSDGYWRNVKEAMAQAIVAQKQDEVGQAKLKKNLNSMNRDFDALYTPIYKNGMAKYAIDAALRIREEQSEQQEKYLSKQTSPATYREEVCAEESKRKPGDQENDEESTHNSPSEASVQLFVGDQTNLRAIRKGRFCLMVNQPGGCTDRDTCGYDSHDNEGRLCQAGPDCTFGLKCAFVHSVQQDMAPRRPSALRPQGSDLHLQDLRPILNEVLASPRTYKVCTWVNKSKGCNPKNGKPCIYNHTLRGIICEGYQRGDCALGYHVCPLRHVYYESSVHDPPTASGGYSERFTSEARPRPPFRAIDQSQNYQSGHITQHDVHYHHMELQNQEPHPPSFLDQSVVDRGLQSNIPTDPRGLYMQIAGVPSPIYEDNTYTSQRGWNGSKRKRGADYSSGSFQAAPSNMLEDYHEYNHADVYEMKTPRVKRSPDKKPRMTGRKSGHNGKRREKGQGGQRRRGGR